MVWLALGENDKFVPRGSDHRRKLHPVFPSITSHLNRIANHETQTDTGPGQTGENRNARKKILQASEADLVEFEATVFEEKPSAKFRCL